MVFGLVKARHEKIRVDHYIFDGKLDDVFGFSEMYDQAVERLAMMPAGQDKAIVYVTGLTTAMLAVVKACIDMGLKLDAMHWCKKTDNFIRQAVIE